MKISPENVYKLCEIARQLNEMQFNDMWEELNTIIGEIEEEGEE
jgi:hypothetical protein